MINSFRVLRPRLFDNGSQAVFDKAFGHPAYHAAQPYIVLHSENVVLSEVVGIISRVFHRFGFSVQGTNSRILDEYVSEILRYHCERKDAKPMESLMAIYLYITQEDHIYPEVMNWLEDINEAIVEELSKTRAFSIYPEYYTPTGYEYIEVIVKDGFLGFSCLGDIRILEYMGAIS